MKLSLVELRHFERIWGGYRRNKQGLVEVILRTQADSVRIFRSKEITFLSRKTQWRRNGLSKFFSSGKHIKGRYHV